MGLVKDRRTVRACTVNIDWARLSNTRHEMASIALLTPENHENVDCMPFEMGCF